MSRRLVSHLPWVIFQLFHMKVMDRLIQMDFQICHTISLFISISSAEQKMCVYCVQCFSAMWQITRLPLKRFCSRLSAQLFFLSVKGANTILCLQWRYCIPRLGLCMVMSVLKRVIDAEKWQREETHSTGLLKDVVIDRNVHIQGFSGFKAYYLNRYDV